MKLYRSNDRRFDVWELIYETALLLGKARRRELMKYKVSQSKAAILLCIKTLNNKATPAQISRWLFREPQSVSGILNRMEKQKLITKSTDPNRKNILRVELTAKGAEIYGLTTERKSIHEIMSALSKEERNKLASLLMRIQKKTLDFLKI